MLRDPARVAVTPVASTVERITQRIIQVDLSDKPAFLAQLLKQEPVDRALVFTRTKHGADKVVKSLVKAGIPADAIHGNKSQNHRERVLAAFRTGDDPHPGRHRHRRPRHRCRRHQPCGQFRPAQRARNLCPPHRPHRARRRRRHRDLADRGRRGNGLSARHRAADPRDAAAGRPPHPGQPRMPRPPAAQHRAGRPAPRAHAARPHENAPGSSKGPRRRRRGGGNHGAPQTNRHESAASSRRGGKADGMQGVAFLHRESRPNTKPNRTQRPSASRRSIWREPWLKKS